jgi:hypothetical protein
MSDSERGIRWHRVRENYDEAYRGGPTVKVLCDARRLGRLNLPRAQQKYLVGLLWSKTKEPVTYFTHVVLFDDIKRVTKAVDMRVF